MKAVIHQPYFLPWMGYFSKLIYADKFIVLDNVNFSKRHFIDRVQIINSEGNLIWIGMNVGEQYKVKCNEIFFEDNKRVENIIVTLKSAYSKARHFKYTIEQVETIITGNFIKYKNIVEINLNIILQIMNLLDYKLPEIVLASSYSEFDDATQRIMSLLKLNNCDTLITGSGGSLDKHDVGKLSLNGIDVYLQDYYQNHPIYYQTRRTKLGFCKGLSVIDCIFNEGIDKTKELISDINCRPELYVSSSFK